MFSDPEIMALLGIFVGVIFRMAIPYLRKKREAEVDGKSINFMKRYFYAGLFALMVAIVTTFIGFMQFPIPTDVSTLTFFIGAVVYGYGLNSLITEVMENTFEKPS